MALETYACFVLFLNNYLFFVTFLISLITPCLKKKSLLISSNLKVLNDHIYVYNNLVSPALSSALITPVLSL